MLLVGRPLCPTARGTADSSPNATASYTAAYPRTPPERSGWFGQPERGLCSGREARRCHRAQRRRREPRDALLEREFRATRLQSSGGFLKQSNATVLLGVEDDEVDEVMGIVRESCHSRSQIVNPMPPIMEPGEFFMPYPLEVEVGGATVFVVPVERFERL